MSERQRTTEETALEGEIHDLQGKIAEAESVWLAVGHGGAGGFLEKLFPYQYSCIKNLLYITATAQYPRERVAETLRTFLIGGTFVKKNEDGSLVLEPVFPGNTGVQELEISYGRKEDVPVFSFSAQLPPIREDRKSGIVIIRVVADPRKIPRDVEYIIDMDEEVDIPGVFGGIQRVNFRGTMTFSEHETNFGPLKVG